MKRLGLAVAAAAALLALPLAARAQGRIQDPSKTPAASTGAPTKGGAAAAPTAADKTRGLKEAPPLVAASDVKTCQVADAAFRGSGSQKGADGKSAKFTAYEVSCRQGPGYLVLATEGQAKPQMINCIIAAAQAGGTKCALPANQDVKAELQPYVQAAGRTCDIGQSRYVGSTKTGLTYYEVGCTGAAGFLMAVSDAGDAPTITDCLSVQGTAQACQFTTKEQELAVYQPLVARSGKTCQVSDVRVIGASKETGDTYTELACGSAPGFMLVQDKMGAYKSTIDCGKADNIGGGCKMTDATVAQTQDTAAYTKLAAKAGYPCAVSKYRFIGQDSQNREVVELACSDHPDGAIAVLSETGKSDIYDCVRAPAIGDQTCRLTQASVVYPKYTAALAAKGRSTCKVSGASYLGRTTGGTEYVETACADGNPGWVIGFKAGTTTADEVLTCKQAGSSGLPRKQPTNTKG